MLSEVTVDWNGKKSNRAQSDLLPGQMYSGVTVNTVKGGVLVMYMAHAVLLNFIMELLQKLILNAGTRLGFIPVEYEERDGGVEELEHMECSKTGCMISRSELVAADGLITLKTSLVGCDEKMTIVHIGTRYILNGL